MKELLDALEQWIESIVTDMSSPHVEDAIRRREIREALEEKLNAQTQTRTC